MNVQTGSLEKRPYAATANVMAVLKRVRTRNLPDRIGGEFYTLAGVNSNVHGRVTQALTFLGLIDEDGYPQDSLRAMAQAPEAEFLELLSACVREAYASEFRVVDPTQDPQSTILGVFQKYQPRSQTSRMVMLFLGLCREAGMQVKDVPRDRKMAAPSKPKRPRGDTAPPVGTAVQKRTSTPSTPPPTEPSASGLLFGISVSDISALDEADFTEVWTALGKVARARARTSQEVAAPQLPTEEEGGEEWEEEIEET